jgi:hypothetical protein
MLRKIELIPEGLDELKRTLILRFEMARVTPGQTVGYTAAEALAAISTQMTLKTVHTAGSSTSVSSGIAALTSILYVTSKSPNPTTNIFFRDPNYTLKEVLDKRSSIVGVTVRSVMKSHEILSVTEATYAPWYDDAKKLLNVMPSSPYLLRITLNKTEMLRMRVLPSDIAKTIESHKMMRCVYGPIWADYLDIHPIEEAMYSRPKEFAPNPDILRENVPQVFLDRIVADTFDILYIKGIEGLDNYTPIATPVWQVVQEEIQPQSGQQRDDHSGAGFQWLLQLNERRMQFIGIDRQRLIVLLNFLGITVIDSPEDVATMQVRVRMPVDFPGKPSDLLKRRIKEDLYDAKVYRLREGHEREISQLERLGNVCYVRCDGNNLNKVLIHPQVDPSRSYTNNIHEITKIFGVEAGKNFMCSEIANIMRDTGNTVNHRHISVVATFVCARGYPYSIKFHGAVKQSLGTFATATLQQTAKQLVIGAAVGQYEAMNTASALATGRLVPGIGTGNTHLVIDQPLLDAYDDELKKQRSERAINIDRSMISRLTEGVAATGIQEEPVRLGTSDDFDEKRLLLQGDPDTTGYDSSHLQFDDLDQGQRPLKPTVVKAAAAASAAAPSIAAGLDVKIPPPAAPIMSGVTTGLSSEARRAFEEVRTVVLGPPAGTGGLPAAGIEIITPVVQPQSSGVALGGKGTGFAEFFGELSKIY